MLQVIPSCRGKRLNIIGIVRIYKYYSVTALGSLRVRCVEVGTKYHCFAYVDEIPITSLEPLCCESSSGETQVACTATSSSQSLTCRELFRQYLWNSFDRAVFALAMLGIFGVANCRLITSIGDLAQGRLLMSAWLLAFLWRPRLMVIESLSTRGLSKSHTVAKTGHGGCWIATDVFSTRRFEP